VSHNCLCFESQHGCVELPTRSGKLATVEWLEKILPFLSGAPRWLQIVSLAVFVQVLAVTFLVAVYTLNSEHRKGQPRRVAAQVIRSDRSQEPRISTGSNVLFPEPALETFVPDTVGLEITATLEDIDGFPVSRVTLLNNTGKTQVVDKFVVDVRRYMPYASIPKTRVMETIAVVDVKLPLGKTRDTWQLARPVLIASGDAASFEFRFRCEYDGKPIEPSRVARYSIALRLETISGAHATLNDLEL